MKPPFFKSNRGMALIVVLAFTVLVTTVVIATYSRTTAMRRVSFSSRQQAQACELARSAMDILVSELRQEIVNGSNPEPPSGGYTLYVSTDPAYLVPQRNVSTSGTIPSLLRISSSRVVSFPGVDLFPASAASTTATSANGRSISPTRWNRHYLVPRLTTSGSSIPTPVTAFPAPSWVYVTDEGPVVLTATSSRAIGRYAYAIYDQSGLLDMNVAGYPTASAAATVAKKGVLAFADLTRLGLSGSMVNNIVGWRNYATANASGESIRALSINGADAYCRSVLANADGFMKVGGASGRTDQAFLTRLELLELRRELRWDEDTLQHLGTFTRAVTAPSRFHDIRFLRGGWLQHYNDDGTPGLVPVGEGEPLLHSRFSLKRLALVAPETSGTALRACFGISCNSMTSGTVSFTYIGPAESPSSDIKSLADVVEELKAAADSGDPILREPNFFELLKAGMIAKTGAVTDAKVLKTGSAIINKYLANNQVYQSVGGLGFVDGVDFWATDIDYSPLLDLFSAIDEPAVSAGKLNPNSAHNMGLYALLSTTALNDTGSSRLTDSTALSLAYNLPAKFATPIADPSGLPGALATLSNRKAGILALSSVTNARTWNLLIDVVAQSGVFPPNAGSLDRFVVQSERRYWLHLAIDRLTGKVVDRQIEPVYE
ncbi:MAG: hypothetical protein ACFUZC_17960 [Chthoniobacteraceae bacterium]